MDKRYQVFVSSTYADLKEERRAVIQAIMQLDCIPAGMELFPAADEQQFEFIKRVIDDCDYYLLIIGETYGSIMSDGISYTEKEYDYAVGRGLRVIALVHENPDETADAEETPLLRERLENFKTRVSANRLVKPWRSAGDLPALALSNLAYAMKTYPAVGWIRADKAASEDLLQEINDLRKQNNQLQAEVAEHSSEPAVENLAGLEEKMPLSGMCTNRYNGQKDAWRASLSWREIFAFISPYLVRFPADEYVKSILAENALATTQCLDYWVAPSLVDQQFRTVAVQLEALKLVKLNWSEKVGGGYGLFWSLTPYGQRLMLELRTVKSSAGTEDLGNKGIGR